MTNVPPSIADQIKAMNPITWGLPVYAGTKQGGYLPPEEAADRLDNLEALERAKNAKARTKREEAQERIMLFLSRNRSHTGHSVADICDGLDDMGHTYAYNSVYDWCAKLFAHRKIKRTSKKRYLL